MYFPLFVDLTGRKLLVVGGGRIASRRVRVLCAFCPKITVVALSVSEEIRTLREKYDFALNLRAFRDSDLDGADLVLAATDDEELNSRIGVICRQRGIPVNVCSDRALCDFQFPSVLQNGSVVIGVNASGQDHRLVKQTRKRLEAILADDGFTGGYPDE